MRWIQFRSEICRNPRWRRALGDSIWLYARLVDIANWKFSDRNGGGFVDRYSDQMMADIMAVSLTWVRQRRERLEAIGLVELRDTMLTVSAYGPCSICEIDGIEPSFIPYLDLAPESSLAPPTTPPIPGDLYFIRGDGLIKIGISTNVEKRLKDMQIGSPAPLELIGTIRDGAGQEEQIHERFAHLRRHGEWFQWTEELQRFIEEHTE